MDTRMEGTEATGTEGTKATGSQEEHTRNGEGQPRERATACSLRSCLRCSVSLCWVRKSYIGHRGQTPYMVSDTLQVLTESRAYGSSAAIAAPITCAGVHPRARSSRMPVSPSDLLSFCDGDFMINE
jgi:hypothetical protein